MHRFAIAGLVRVPAWARKPCEFRVGAFTPQGPRQFFGATFDDEPHRPASPEVWCRRMARKFETRARTTNNRQSEERAYCFT